MQRQIVASGLLQRVRHPRRRSLPPDARSSHNLAAAFHTNAANSISRTGSLIANEIVDDGSRTTLNNNGEAGNQSTLNFQHETDGTNLRQTSTGICDARNGRSRSVPPRNSQIAQNFSHNLPLFSNPYENDAPTIKMFTDGSCLSNLSAGIGVYFLEHHSLNISKRVGPPFNSGFAEIVAAQEGLNCLIQWPNYNAENVKVCTDYLPLIRSLAFPSQFERFANEIFRLREIAQRFPRGVLFQHVYAHTGELGNEEADRLARQAIGLGRSRSRSRSRSRKRSRSRSRSPSQNRNRRSSSSSRPRSEEMPQGGGVVYIPPLTHSAINNTVNTTTNDISEKTTTGLVSSSETISNYSDGEATTTSDYYSSSSNDGSVNRSNSYPSEIDSKTTMQSSSSQCAERQARSRTPRKTANTNLILSSNKDKKRQQ